MSHHVSSSSAKHSSSSAKPQYSWSVVSTDAVNVPQPPPPPPSLSAPASPQREEDAAPLPATQAGLLSMANRGQLELLTTAWVMKVKQSCCTAAPLTTFPLPPWSPQQLRRVANLSAELLISHYDERLQGDVAEPLDPLPAPVRHVLDAASAQCNATRFAATSQPLVLLDLIRDGGVLEALHVVASRVLSSRLGVASRPAMLEAVLRMVLEFLAMLTSTIRYALAEGQTADHHLRDAMCVAAPMSVACLSILENVVRSLALRAPPNRSKKGTASNSMSNDREIKPPKSAAETCRLCAVVEDAMLDSATIASTVHAMVRTWFNADDNTFPAVVVRFAFQWCAVCSASMQAHSAALDGVNRSHIVALQQFVVNVCDTICTQSKGEDAQGRWPLLLIAALGTRVEWPPLQHPHASLRTQAQWSAVRTGLMDVGGKLLQSAVLALLASSSPSHTGGSSSSSPSPSLELSIAEWQPTVVTLLRRLDDHSGSHHDAILFVDGVLRTIEEQWVAVVSPVPADATPSERKPTKQHQQQTTKPRSAARADGDVCHLAALLWDLITLRNRASEALLKGDRGSNVGTEQILSLLWKRILRFHSDTMEAVASRTYDALVRHVTEDAGRVLSVLRSMVLPPRPTPVSSATVAAVRSPLLGWLGTATTVDGREGGHELMERFRRTLRSLVDAQTERSMERGTTLNLASPLFQTMSTLLHDLVQTTPSATVRTPTRDGLLRDVVEHLIALHNVSDALHLGDGGWTADDLSAVIDALCVRSSRGGKQTDGSSQRRGGRSSHGSDGIPRRVLSVCSGYVASTEQALRLLNLAPAAIFTADADSPNAASQGLVGFVAGAATSASSRVRAAALQVAARKGLSWPPTVVGAEQKGNGGGKTKPTEGNHRNNKVRTANKSSSNATQQQPAEQPPSTLLLRLFHNMLSAFSQAPQADFDLDACCVALTMASSPCPPPTDDDSSWLEALVNNGQGVDGEPWQLRVGRALADDVVRHLSVAETMELRQGDEVRSRAREGKASMGATGPTATDVMELALAFLRDRRWESEVPKALRAGYGHCSTLLALLLSHLERAASTYTQVDAIVPPLTASPTAVRMLHRWAPTIRHQLCDLGVFLVRFVVDPACTRFATSWGRGSGGCHAQLLLKQELLSLSLRVGLQRMKDLRQLAAALASSTTGGQAAAAAMPHHRGHGGHRDDTAQRKRTSMCLELVKTLGASAFVRLQWDDVDANGALDGHLQGVGALATRLMPDLLQPPASSAADTSMGSFFSAVGTSLLCFLIDGLLSSAEAHHAGDTTTALLHTLPLSRALTDHGNTAAVVAVLVLFSEPQVRRLFIELSCAALANGEAHDERDLLMWFAQLKDDLRGALRCFKSDGLMSRQVRDAVLDSGLLTKEAVGELHAFVAHVLPAEHWSDEHQQSLVVPSGTSSNARAYRTYDLGGSTDAAMVRVRLRRTECSALLANAVQWLHTSRANTDAVLHMDKPHGEGSLGPDTDDTSKERVYDDVPDVCRDVEKLLLDDSDDEAFCGSSAASPIEPLSPSHCTPDIKGGVDKAPRPWEWLARDMLALCSKRGWLLRTTHRGTTNEAPATVEALRRLTKTSNTTLLRRHRAEVGAGSSMHEGALLRSVVWIAIEAKIRLLTPLHVANRQDGGEECIVDLDREVEVVAEAMDQLVHCQRTTTASSCDHALYAAFAHALVDWTRYSLLPTTQADPTRRTDILHRLSGLLTNALVNGGHERPTDLPTAAATPPGNAMLSWLRATCELCPHHHRAILQRQLAAHTQNLLLTSSSEILREGFSVAAVTETVCRHDIDGAERAHWVARLLMRMVEAEAPIGAWDEVLTSARQNPHNWTSSIATEVAVALLCKTTAGDAPTPMYPTHVSESLAKLVSMSVRLPVTATAGTSDSGYVPSTLFLINSLRFSHIKAFDVLCNVLPVEDRNAIATLHAYGTALEAVALTPPELGCSAANQMADDAERFVTLLQEILAEVAGPSVEEKPTRPVPGAREELPELGAETSMGEAGHDTSLTPLYDECHDLLTGLVAQVDHTVLQLIDTMDRRLAPGGTHTWFDAAMWYVDPPRATDLGPVLPSVHPHHRGGVLHGVLDTVHALIASAVSNLQQLRNKRGLSPGKVAAQLGEFIGHTSLMVRQDLCGALRRAGSALRAMTDQHVCAWFAPDAPSSGDDKGPCRTITELFAGSVPPVLQAPIPVAFPIKGHGGSTLPERVQLEWKLDLNQVLVTPSQDLPRTIRFRGTQSAAAQGGRNNRRGKTYTQTFLLKGPRQSDKSIQRDRCIVILMEELQRLGQHALQRTSSRSRNPRATTTLEQWLAHDNHTSLSWHDAPAAWPPRAAASMRDALWTPTYAIFPFPSGGGLIEHLHGSATVAAVVEAWQKETLAAAAGENLPANRGQPPSLSLRPPMVQFNETLKSVVDELNARHQEARSKKAPTTAGPRTGGGGRTANASVVAAQQQQRHDGLIDLHRPSPEALKETFLRLLRMQPSSRDVIANAVLSTLDVSGGSGKPSAIASGTAAHLPLDSDREWVNRWSTYTRSLATGSALTYVLGIGDRHLGNILIFTESTLLQSGSNHAKLASAADDGIGRVAHVDFSVCFGAGARLRFPERVPFRMSPVLLQPLGAYGCEGGFAEHLRQALQSMHHNETFATELIATLHQILPSSSCASQCVPQPSDGHRPSAVARKGSATLRGSLLTAVDRVADRAFRQLEGLIATAFAPSTKAPHGSGIAMRQHLFVQCNFQGIASVGQRLSALVDEHRTLRGETSVNAALAAATQRLTDLTTVLNGHVADITESISSCERTSARLGEIVRAVVCTTTESSSESSSNGDDALSALLGCMFALPRCVTVVAPASEVAGDNVEVEGHRSLWQDHAGTTPATLAATTAPIQATMLLKPTALCTSVWGPEGQHASMVDALVAMCEPEHPSQRLLRAVEAAQRATKLLQLCSQHSGQFSLPKSTDPSSTPMDGMQAMVEWLQDWSTHEPLAFHADGVAAAAACDGVMAAARRLVDDAIAFDAPLDDAHMDVESLPAAPAALPPNVPLAVRVWFDTIRLDVWPQLPAMQGEQLHDDAIKACMASECSGRIAAATLLPVGMVESAVDAALRHFNTHDCGTVAWLSPHRMAAALEALCIQLEPSSSIEVVRLFLRSTCALEAQRILRTLFCLWCLMAAPTVHEASTCHAAAWVSNVSHNNNSSPWLVETVVQPVRQALQLLDADAVASGCSAKARHLGEYAGLCCLPEASDAIQRLHTIVSEVVDVHWPHVVKRTAELETVRKELADITAERARLRQRSAVIHNEQRTLGEMLRQALSPVVLNGLSGLTRHIQVAVEGLYKELQTDLLETLLPRLQHRACMAAGGAGRSAEVRSPNQLAAQLMQRATQDCCTILNTIHQLITEGYEVVSKDVARGATSGRKHESDDRSHSELDTAKAVHDLLRVTDAVFLASSVELMDAMLKLFAVLGGLGVPSAQQRLSRIADMRQHALHIAAAIGARSSQHHPADGVAASEAPRDAVADGHSAKESHLHHQRRRVERLVDRILAASNRGRPRRMDANAIGLGGVLMGDLNAALRLGDVAQAIDDTKRRLRMVSEAHAHAQQPRVGCCTAPAPIKQLLRQSIDADVLSAMYPGWTAWI